MVCLAALGAMESIRRWLRGRQDPGGPSHAAGTWHTDIVRQASGLAVAEFWRRVSDFVALGAAPRGWPVLPEHHPFVGMRADGTMRLNR